MKIISGGQTGVDRAALDVALDLNIPYGGSVPKGRTAEDGHIPSRYKNLTETASSERNDRTRQNVIDADGTLLITRGPPGAETGTDYTRTFAAQSGKSLLWIDLNDVGSIDQVTEKITDWLDVIQCRVLNVAGPPHGENPHIYTDASRLLRAVFERLAAESRAPTRDVRQDVTFRVYEQVYNNFRHWDTIRWTVSVGLLAFIATVVGAALSYSGSRAVVPLSAFLGTAIISAVWVYLLWKLVLYHRDSFSRLRADITPVVGGRGGLYAPLNNILPFTFEGPGFAKTATFAFLCVFSATSLLSIVGVVWVLRSEPPASLRDVASSPPTTKDAAVPSGAGSQVPQSKLEPALSPTQWAQLQWALTGLHLYAGKVDGDPGDAHLKKSKTRLAIRTWQRTIGVPPTGWLTQVQIEQLLAAASIQR